MADLINAAVHFIAAHSAWTFPVIFITTFGESFVFVGLIFPGTTIVMAAGLLVSAGTVPLLPVLAGAIAGAVLGDTLSWSLGRHFGHLLTGRWPFTQHPGLLRNDEALFLRYGALSVFIGRFLGPFRAVVSLTAGLMRMPPIAFLAANIVSALVWAPALILPGSLAAAAARLLDIPPQWRLATGLGVVMLVTVVLWTAGKLGWFRGLRRALGVANHESEQR